MWSLFYDLYRWLDSLFCKGLIPSQCTAFNGLGLYPIWSAPNTHYSAGDVLTSSINILRYQANLQCGPHTICILSLFCKKILPNFVFYFLFLLIFFPSFLILSSLFLYVKCTFLMSYFDSDITYICTEWTNVYNTIWMFIGFYISLHCLVLYFPFCNPFICIKWTSVYITIPMFYGVLLLFH